MALITLIPGDGIGPEITDAVVKILDAAGAGLEYDRQDAGLIALEKTGELIPESLMDSIEKTRIALKGPITTPVGKGFRSINVTLRQKYDLYQNLRPVKSVVGVETRFSGVDIVLFRENTEGAYCGLEVADDKNQIGDSIIRFTRKGCERIVRAAFDYAVKHNRKKVTASHKANIHKVTGGMFLAIAQEVAKDYPQIEFEDKIIDNMCMQLVAKPELYDVVVTSNLFGDILSDLLAGLVGGLGIVPGANIGSDCAIFEAVHGSAPDIAGQNKANPSAFLQSAIMMLHYMGKHDIATKVENALFKTLANKELRTGDLGGPASTTQFADNVIANL